MIILTQNIHLLFKYKDKQRESATEIRIERILSGDLREKREECYNIFKGFILRLASFLDTKIILMVAIK